MLYGNKIIKIDAVHCAFYITNYCKDFYAIEK